ncbi:MAG: ABC transporter ATP-binding protein/permease [Verrucomicrobiales bacterium]|nr:ABC transporter ATP-binding protein/permease [Verrucomicrobiales bacterium]
MWPFFRPYRWMALLGVALTMVVGASDGAMVGFLGLFINKITDKPLTAKLELVRPMIDWLNSFDSKQFAMAIPYMIVSFVFVIGCITYASNCINSWVGNRVTMDIKKRLYQKLLSMNAMYFDTNSSGNVLFRFNTDAEAASSGLIDNLKMFLTRLSTSLALIAAMIAVSWKLSSIALVVLVFVFLPLGIARKHMKRIMSKSIASITGVITAYNETFAGNKTIAAYNLQEPQTRKFNTLVDGVFKFAVKMVRNTNWLSPCMHFISAIGIALVVGFGGNMIVHDVISVGAFFTFGTAMIMLYTPLKGIGNNFVSLQYSFMAIERLHEILDLKPQIEDANDAIKLQGVHNIIEFHGVCFEYRPNAPILKNITLSAKVGEMVALVGNSGGGKTTVVNLLPRFYEIKSGSIRIDGTDIRKFTLHSLRQQIGVVFQDNFLFSGTIRENVMLGNPNADEEAVYRALKHAHLSEFIANLEKGIDTEIGERGILLSGGQKQRIAIARAFLKNAPILILDEATSALDNKSEAVVQAAINDLMKGRTVFVIAHRLSTVQNADKIIVLNQGEIVEEGKHQILLEKKGVYASLHQAQFKSQTTTHNP